MRSTIKHLKETCRVITAAHSRVLLYMVMIRDMILDTLYAKYVHESCKKVAKGFCFSYFYSH